MTIDFPFVSATIQWSVGSGVFSLIGTATNSTFLISSKTSSTVLKFDYPAFADAMNEKGLGCAGLNFPGYFHVEEKAIPGKNNLSPYLLLHIYFFSYFQ